MEVHAVAWEATEGPRSIIGPFTWAPIQAWPVPRSQLPSVRVGRGRQASTRAGDHSSTR
jgi:hypothetical protein